MKRNITGTLLALAVTFASGTFHPAGATETEKEIGIGGDEHTSPTSCPTGQTLYRIYCLTHQTHENICQ